MTKNKPALTLTVTGREIPVNRPEPIVSDIDVVPFDRSMNPGGAVGALVEGYVVLVVDVYSSGLTLLQELKSYLTNIHSNRTFIEQRNFRSDFHELSNRIVIEVSNNTLAVKKAPAIGWLKVLYPDMSEFLLPFPQVQGLNSSWQWYKKGVYVPVLNQKINPYFGTYFPTRFEHLELFDDWLSRYQGERKSAIDIGVGSGVLSLQMLKHGFESICGTDSNPNAIVGLNEELKRKGVCSKIELRYGDLFAGHSTKTEFLVFNPPWLPASHYADGIDKAIYYDEELFPRFFSEALKRLDDGGRVVILFSNLAQITEVNKTHPIETELAKGGRFEKETFIQKSVGKASKKTRRNQTWRNSEKVELWVLKKSDNIKNTSTS